VQLRFDGSWHEDVCFIKFLSLNVLYMRCLEEILCQDRKQVL